jgi:NADH-quinone oxidoreductase subunit N
MGGGLLALLAAPSPCLSGNGSRSTDLCTTNASIHIPVAYWTIAPVLILSGGALVLLVISAVLPKRSWPGLWSVLTAVIGVVSTVVSLVQWGDFGRHTGKATIGGQILYDRFSIFFLLLISVATIMGALLADSYLRREGLDGVEAYVLLLLAGSGAMLMAESAGLIMLFLGLEIMSISLYVLAAYHRRRTESGEAGLKYFILGSFSSAIFLYGAALVYGATGSTQFGEIASFLATNTLHYNGVLLAGMALLIVGLGFKVAAVPFHFWTPDVYQGSPTPFTGYMAAVAKAAGFAGMLRVLVEALSTQQANWRPIVWVLAVLTLLVGSVLAIVQRDVKRMLAYSSISQAGYVLIGVQAGTARGTSGALFYLLTYTFIVMGTFAVISVVQGNGESRNDLGAMRGLARRRPLLAFAMLVLLLAQAGVPLTSGFLGKFYVIQAAVQRGQYPLAVIGMLAAAIAAFFYLRLALVIYSAEPDAAGAGGGAAGASGGPVDGTLTAGLVADGGGATNGAGGVATATETEVVLTAPSEAPVEVPVAVGLVLAACVVFTIFAGVSSPIVDFARHATTLF